MTRYAALHGAGAALVLSGCEGRPVPWLSGMAFALVLVVALIILARFFTGNRGGGL